jgi:hypothetical protein
VCGEEESEADDGGTATQEEFATPTIPGIGCGSLHGFLLFFVTGRHGHRLVRFGILSGFLCYFLKDIVVNWCFGLNSALSLVVLVIALVHKSKSHFTRDSIRTARATMALSTVSTPSGYFLQSL